MNTIRKSFMILLVIIMICTVSPAAVFASDNRLPEFSDFTIDRGIANPGDIVNFSIKIDDESIITRTVAHFYSPNHYTYQLVQPVEFAWDESNIYQGKLGIPQSVIPKRSSSDPKVVS